MAKTYEAMKKTGSDPGIACLDLKNRKQTGDLEKKIFHLHQKTDSNIFHFTSCKPCEGVSTVIANLVNYLKLQKTLRKILIIDANMHTPILHSFFRVNNGPGLADALDNKTSIHELTTVIEGTSLEILPAGINHNKHTDTLSQERFSALLEDYRAHYDYIFVDSTTMFKSTDALSIAMASDVTFLVIQALMVAKPVAQKAASMLRDNECTIGGVIFNRVTQVIPGWFYRIM